MGEWKDGEKHGQGTFTWSDEGKYKGYWKDGKFHGLKNSPFLTRIKV